MIGCTLVINMLYSFINIKQSNKLLDVTDVMDLISRLLKAKFKGLVDTA